MSRENDVVVYTLVPHTTHEMQPLEAAVFGPLKHTWQEVCHNYVQSHPGRIITQYQFNEIFSKAWLKSLALLINVISGFKACGIYLFDPKAVLDHDPCNQMTTQAGGILLHSDTENSDGAIAQAAFTEEEEIHFARYYSKGYDLATDPMYLQWLQLNHPEQSNRSLSDYFSAVPPVHQ